MRAPIERVFAEIDAADQWPSWWPGVQSVQLLQRGPAGPVGMRVRNTWKSALPYALTFDAEVTRHCAPTLIEIAASGELVGQGRWELQEHGAVTRVRYHWTVSTSRAWMNLIAPLARPLFRWNHDLVMRWGGEALAKRLGTTLETCS